MEINLIRASQYNQSVRGNKRVSYLVKGESKFLFTKLWNMQGDTVKFANKSLQLNRVFSFHISTKQNDHVSYFLNSKFRFLKFSIFRSVSGRFVSFNLHCKVWIAFCNYFVGVNSFRCWQVPSWSQAAVSWPESAPGLSHCHYRLATMIYSGSNVKCAHYVALSWFSDGELSRGST